jgi:hypothetical protein
VILLSALVGSVATILVTTLFFAIRRIRNPHSPHEPPSPTETASDHPPPDYAAKTSDGFPNAHWSN